MTLLSKRSATGLLRLGRPLQKINALVLGKGQSYRVPLNLVSVEKIISTVIGMYSYLTISIRIKTQSSHALF